MKCKSKHPMDVASWIEKVITSCTTTPQLCSCRKLIKLYKVQYPSHEDVSWKLHRMYSDRFDEIIDDQINNRINNLNNKDDEKT